MSDTTGYPIERVNPRGLKYHLFPVGPEKTIIALGDKQIQVYHSVERISQAWYDWTIKDQYVQDAFRFLSSEEREFILTGITGSEWNEIFKDEPE